MPFDPFFTSQRRKKSKKVAREAKRLFDLPKLERYRAYHGIKCRLYAGKKVTPAEEVFYHEVRNIYNALYHQAAENRPEIRNLSKDPNRIQELP